MFDQTWKPRQERREYRILDAPTSQVIQRGENGGFVLDRLTAAATAGAYNYALEIRDRISQHTGSARASLVVEDFRGASLMMSSVLLASEVMETNRAAAPAGAGTPGLYTKDGLDVVPVLDNVFSVNTPLYVYYEVYNLQLGADGFCRYRVDSRVEPAADSSGALAGVVRGLGRLLGMRRQRAAITSSFESGSMNSTEKLYHAVEISGAKPGRYHVTLKVSDLHSGQAAERQLTVTIAGSAE
jgi:hypothetical protein